MPFQTCCVPGCTSRITTVRSYSLPRSVPLLNLWLSYLTRVRPDFSFLDPSQLRERKICKRHFEARFFRNGVRVQQSCPTLFSIDEIDTGIPQTPVNLGHLHTDHDHTYGLPHDHDHTYAARYYPVGGTGADSIGPGGARAPPMLLSARLSPHNISSCVQQEKKISHHSPSNNFIKSAPLVGGEVSATHEHVKCDRENLVTVMEEMTLGELASWPPSAGQERNFDKIKSILDEYYPEDWRSWQVRDVSYAELFGDGISPETEARLRFALPTALLASALNLSSLSEQKYKYMKRVLRKWPLGRALTYSPLAIMNKVHRPEAYDKFADLVLKLKPKLVSRQQATATRPGCVEPTYEYNAPPRRVKDNSPAATMDESHHTDDALADVPDVEVTTEKKSMITIVGENNLDVWLPQKKIELTTCRTCLRKYLSRYTVSLFTVDRRTGQSYNHMMHSTIRIQAAQNDEFPTSLCLICKQTVLRCYNFQLQAKKANRILQSKTRSHNFGARVKDEQSQENTQLDNDTHFMDYEQCDNSDLKKPDKDTTPVSASEDIVPTEVEVVHYQAPTQKKEKPTPKLIPNQCRRCLRSFNNALELLQHIRSKHRNLITNKTVRNKANLVTPATGAARSRRRATRKPRERGTPRKRGTPRGSGTPKEKRKQRVANLWRPREGERCSICCDVFPTTDTLNDHCMTHGATEVIMCALCERVYLKYSQFKRHFTVHHPDMELINQTENTATIVEMKDPAAMLEILQHVRLTSIGDLITANLPPSDEPAVVDAFVHTCGLCGCIILSREGVELHNQTEHLDYATRCCYCGMHFSRMTFLIPHQNHCKSTPMKYECLPCGQRFYSESGLRKHGSREHSHMQQVCEEDGGAEGEQDADDNKTCEMCGMIFRLKSSLRVHRTTWCSHGPRRLFKCDHCEKVYKMRNSLIQHIMLMHGSKRPDRRYLCSLCGKAFTWQTSLRMHTRRHTGETPFVCSVCQKGFISNYELRVHLWRHGGILRYKCEQCGKGFVRKPALQRHMTIHTGERPHKCNQCDAAFRLKENLITHMKKHLPSYDESLVLNPEPIKKVEVLALPTAEEISSGHWEEGGRKEDWVSSKRARTGSARVRAISSSQKKRRSKKKGKSNPLILYDSDD